MNIDKLGITPGPWKGLHGGGIDKRGNKHVVPTNPMYSQICIINKTDNDTANSSLIAAAPEMLEALINMLLKDEIHQQKFGAGIVSNVIRLKYKQIIERATGKSWEEVKELVS